MDDTEMTVQWIVDTTKKHPPKKLDNGNCLSGLVRLSFAHLFELPKPKEGITPKYGANLIFPPTADLLVLKDACAEAARTKWPNFGQAGGPKLRTPFKDQSEMFGRFKGFGEEGQYIIVTSDERRPVVDQRMQAITDKTRAASGFWAIVSIRPFVYDKGVNKGVSFGLQSTMIVAEDTVLSGGGSNPQADFAGVSIDASVNPAEAFGNDAPAAKSARDLF
jgi:hypothetical protein